MPENGPRMVGPKLTRADYFESHSYTLTVAEAVTVHLTDRQARDLYQQLHEEFKPKARLPYPPNVKCVCGDLIHPDMPYVVAEPDGSLWHGNVEGGGHKSNAKLT